MPYSSLASVPMMAWLQQSSLRRNRSVRPCLLLYLHRAHTMLLMKMPVEETKRPAATPLKRVGPFEVLPLPQQTAAKRRNVFSNAAAATACGLAPRRLLVERTEVSEQPITTYRTSTFGTHFWLTTRRPVLRCEPLGPCCLRLRLPLRGRAGGTQNFFSKLCFQSCFWTLSSCTRSVCRRTPLVCSQTGWRESEPSKLLICHWIR